jgi:hypothetical protein
MTAREGWEVSWSPAWSVPGLVVMSAILADFTIGGVTAALSPPACFGLAAVRKNRSLADGMANESIRPKLPSGHRLGLASFSPIAFDR